MVPVHRWADEIEAAVDSTVDDVSSIQSTFILQILLKLSVDVLHDRLETEHSQTHIRQSATKKYHHRIKIMNCLLNF